MIWFSGSATAMFIWKFNEITVMLTVQLVFIQISALIHKWSLWINLRDRRADVPHPLLYFWSTFHWSNCPETVLWKSLRNRFWTYLKWRVYTMAGGNPFFKFFYIHALMVRILLKEMQLFKYPSFISFRDHPNFLERTY